MQLVGVFTRVNDVNEEARTCRSGWRVQHLFLHDCPKRAEELAKVPTKTAPTALSFQFDGNRILSDRLNDVLFEIEAHAAGIAAQHIGHGEFDAPAAGGFDLDDVGAEVAQYLGGVGAWAQSRQVEDLQTKTLPNRKWVVSQQRLHRIIKI